jgi:S-adenosylmethionine/arginine decarboxylase-like enzyme
MSFEYNGVHLMVDVCVADAKELTRPEPGVHMLEKIIEEIDMTMILPPVTVKFPHATCEMKRVIEDLESEGLGESSTAASLREKLLERKNESYGYSTFAMIAESHLTIHTFPELKYFSFDCYSCKNFDTDKVMAVIKEFFNVTSVTVQVAPRRVPNVTEEV